MDSSCDFKIIVKGKKENFKIVSTLVNCIFGEDEDTVFNEEDMTIEYSDDWDRFTEESLTTFFQIMDTYIKVMQFRAKDHGMFYNVDFEAQCEECGYRCNKFIVTRENEKLTKRGTGYYDTVDFESGSYEDFCYENGKICTEEEFSKHIEGGIHAVVDEWDNIFWISEDELLASKIPEEIPEYKPVEEISERDIDMDVIDALSAL